MFSVVQQIIKLVGQSYKETLAIIFEGQAPESFRTYFINHMLSVGLCEETVKLIPSLLAFTSLKDSWEHRNKEDVARIIRLALIGGLAFGIGEGIHYHYTEYAPSGFGWGIYATRFMALVLMHSVWAGISAWVLVFITARWLLSSAKTPHYGYLLALLTIALTVLASDFLHTCHNLSNSTIWQLTWDFVSIYLFCWLARFSNTSQIQHFVMKGVPK